MKQLYKRAPKEYSRAAIGLYNRQAFTLRELAIGRVHKNMTIRADKFVKGSIRVEMARGSDFTKARSKAGSATRKRFTGWKEQERGGRSKVGRTHTIEARRGQWGNKVAGSARAKRSNEFIDAEKVGEGKSKSARVSSFLRGMKAGKIKKRPFKIRSNHKGSLKGLSRGLFKIARGKIKRLQSFTPPKKTKRKPWMAPALRELESKFNLQREWNKQLKRLLKRLRNR